MPVICSFNGVPKFRRYSRRQRINGQFCRKNQTPVRKRIEAQDYSEPQELRRKCRRNIGSRYATGKYLAFLDPDTQVDGKWLKEAIAYMEERPTVAAVQCKLVLLSDPSRI